MDGDEPPCPSPYLLKDISNFKTPRRPSLNLNAQSPSTQFFTASKQTPRSSSLSRRPSISPPTKKSAEAARKLKAFELEKSQSSRKAQIKKEQSLKSLAKSITVRLNLLLEKSSSCSCDLSIAGVRIWDEDSAGSVTKGKRDSGPGISVGVDSACRTPKRQGKAWSLQEHSIGTENATEELPGSMYSYLRDSLKNIRSFDDLKQRMMVYLSLGNCKAIFQVMNQVAKAIDEGRLNLKSHCPIVADVG